MYFLRMPFRESIWSGYPGGASRGRILRMLSDEDKREFEAEILEGIVKSIRCREAARSFSASRVCSLPRKSEYPSEKTK